MAVTRINKKQMSEVDKEYEASLKSIETENKIDRIFYRPIGFRIARMLRGTGITPNMITVISILASSSSPGMKKRTPATTVKRSGSRISTNWSLKPATR